VPPRLRREPIAIAGSVSNTRAAAVITSRNVPSPPLTTSSPMSRAA
jgi:hypothetical protein